MKIHIYVRVGKYGTDSESWGRQVCGSREKAMGAIKVMIMNRGCEEIRILWEDEDPYNHGILDGKPFDFEEGDSICST